MLFGRGLPFNSRTGPRVTPPLVTARREILSPSSAYDGLVDATLVLTHDCNLGCSYCYTGRKFRKVMPDDVAEASLALAFSGVAPGGQVQLSYFGGEPLLEWDRLVRHARRARELAAERGVKVRQSVTTNGTLLTKERVAELAELELYVGLSIDGNRAAHEANRPTMSGKSSFDDVSRGLDLLLEAGRAFETISVVTPASVAAFGPSVEELFARGVPRVSVNPCYEAVWTDEHIELWERGLLEALGAVARWLRSGRVISFSPFDAKIIARIKGGLGAADACSLGERFVAVSPDGHLYPCERLVAEDEDPRYRIGHVDGGIDASGVRAMRSHMPDHHATNDECGSCEEAHRCSAFCACANLAETGQVGVAGGVQCWYERTTMALADQLADAMMQEKNEPFLRWFFPGGAPEALPAVRGAQAIERDGKRHLAVVD